jgi:hypothetical protein
VATRKDNKEKTNLTHTGLLMEGLGLQMISRKRCQTAYLINWLKSTSPIEKHHQRAIGECHPSVAVRASY